MLEIVIFHSGDTASVPYQKVRGVADANQKKFGDQLELAIYTTDSEQANAYNCRGSIAVFVNRKLIDLEVATSEKKNGDLPE